MGTGCRAPYVHGLPQIEANDAEIERLQNGKKKAKPPPRLAHLEESAMRHKAHVARLEQIMRLLDNEARPIPCILLLFSGVKPSIAPYPLCILDAC